MKDDGLKGTLEGKQGYEHNTTTSQRKNKNLDIHTCVCIYIIIKSLDTPIGINNFSFNLLTFDIAVSH